MDIYLDGSLVTLVVPFVDSENNPIAPSDVAYKVLSEDNTELVALTTVTLSAGDTSTTIEVDSTNNTLDTGVRKALRVIELVMTTPMGTVTSSTRYVIESHNTLKVGETSFQTYNQALLASLDMMGVERWTASTDGHKKAALIEAYFNLAKLRFKIGDVALMTADTLATLDAKFIDALNKAQVAEADYLLGGDTVEDKRRIGLMSETIGESSNMFRPGKPLILPVSDRALSYLSGYITWGTGLGRA